MMTRAANAGKGPERAILHDAIAAFEDVSGMEAMVLQTDVPSASGGMADALVRLGDAAPRVVEVKHGLTPATLGAAVAQLQRLGRPGMLVTRYVTPQVAERLKELDVGFLDTAGNAYVRDRGILVYVTGRKPPEATAAERPVRAFRASGLKVIFALLCLPDLLASPYREIAGKAGVALGTVTIVLRDLERLGYLRRRADGRRSVENRAGLVDAWAEAYVRELRPRLRPRRYRVADSGWWKTEDLGGLGIQLGGEPAAALLTRHLRPEIVTIYGDAKFAMLAKRIRPARDDDGRLEVLQRFWSFESPVHVKGYPLVPPLLVYADLVASGDARNLEIAEMIRERYLDEPAGDG